LAVCRPLAADSIVVQQKILPVSLITWLEVYGNLHGAVAHFGHGRVVDLPDDSVPDVIVGAGECGSSFIEEVE
jgi:hypothetical protein